MHNEPPALSEAAQDELKRLERAMTEESMAAGTNLNFAHRDFLKALATEEIPDFADVAVKQQGIDALRKSREEYEVAVELKAYAAREIFPGTSAAVVWVPEWASLDKLLAHLMPKVAGQARRARFTEFLTYEAEREVDRQMEFHPKNLTREEYVAELVCVRLANLEHADIPRMSLLDIEEEFRPWWKSQDEGNPLAEINAAKKQGKAEKLEAMLHLLPWSKRANETMALCTWKARALKMLGIPDRTFYRYRQELAGRFVENPTGRFRVNKDRRERK